MRKIGPTKVEKNISLKQAEIDKIWHILLRPAEAKIVFKGGTLWNFNKSPLGIGNSILVV